VPATFAGTQALIGSSRGIPVAASDPMQAKADTLIRVALFALVLAVFTHTRADPDLWGHVRFGDDMIAARGVSVVVDTYSFASDRPWINHEWLAEVLMSLAYTAGSGTGLIFLKLALMLGTLWVAVSAAPGNLSEKHRALMMGLVVIGTVPQASHVRPQLFSLFIFTLVLKNLLRETSSLRQEIERGIVLSALIAVWANLHGGWIVGIGTIGMWALVTLAERRRRQQGIALACVTVTGFLSTIANPYGWRLWQFLGETVRFGRDQITDWQPVYAVGIAYGLLWLLSFTVAVAAIFRTLRTRTSDPRSIAVVLMLGVASFRVNRLLGFFALAVAMLLVRAFELPSAAAVTPHQHRHPSPARLGQRPRAAIAALIGALVLSGGVVTSYDNARCVRMEDTMFPEPDAALAVSARQLQGRMLTWFDWGEYAIWHFAPRVSVSMDGRRETVYSEDVINQQFRFYFFPEERHAILADLRPEYIWLPANLDVTNALVADGWTRMFSGPRSVLLSRHPTPNPAIPLPAVQGRRCFPGP
jgi:hypothetical protein